jgi:hypothetical protein
MIFASLFGAGLLAITWQEYYPRSTLLEVVGINGPRARSRRRCEAVYSHKNAWMHPSMVRMVMCSDPDSFRSRFAAHDIVRVDALTRRVVSATKVWLEPDSTRWTKDIDSVSRSVIAMGGVPYKCKFQPTIAPPSSWSYWKVRGYFVRVTALGSNYEDLTPYQIQISGQSEIPNECLHPPRMVEFSNVCAGATLRVPLPGNYEWCWKSPFGL